MNSLIEREIEKHHEHLLDAESSAKWRQLLTGGDKGLQRLRHLWKHVPSSPRCKVCAAPFSGLGGVATRVFMHGRSNANPLLCNACFGTLKQRPGGAEIDVSVLFADVRGSTGLAERIGAVRFRELLQRFYHLAGHAIERQGGIIDKFLGDGIMALFIPVTAGANHPAKAIAAGREMIEVNDRELAEAGVSFGAGVNTGPAFVGVLGTGEKLDFSALGDTVNATARLGSLAGPGELLVSASTWNQAGLPTADTVRRSVELTGREQPLEVIYLAAKQATGLQL